jgi:hypothetical protein
MNPNPDLAPHPGFQWQKVGITYRRNDFVTSVQYISSKASTNEKQLFKK